MVFTSILDCVKVKKKYWLKQIKLFPVEGQVMTSRTLWNPLIAVPPEPPSVVVDEQSLTCVQLTNIEFRDFKNLQETCVIAAQ